MIADRKDVSLGIEKRHSEAQSRLLPMARILAGAAPVMDGLTRTNEFERYCTYLQGMAERFKQQKQAAQLKLEDPSVTDDKDVRKLRQDVFEANVWISAMQFAIELPAAILQGGKEADQFIATFEKKNEPAAEGKS